MTKPNILLIFSDQQHWHALGCVDPFFDTPNLDQFYKESIVFAHAYCSTPQCSPSRSTLLTGLYPTKTGVLGNTNSKWSKYLNMKTIGNHLQKNGVQVPPAVDFSPAGQGDDGSPVHVPGWIPSVPVCLPWQKG